MKIKKFKKFIESISGTELVGHIGTKLWGIRLFQILYQNLIQFYFSDIDS